MADETKQLQQEIRLVRDELTQIRRLLHALLKFEIRDRRYRETGENPDGDSYAYGTSLDAELGALEAQTYEYER